MSIPKYVGDTLPEHYVQLEIDSIERVVPMKYNAIDQWYEVCAQKDATHMAIILGEDSIKCTVLVAVDCVNKEMLVDIL